jgi:hypothetical protein
LPDQAIVRRSHETNHLQLVKQIFLEREMYGRPLIEGWDNGVMIEYLEKPSKFYL